MYSYGDYCYQVVYNKATWADAKASCEKDDGTLAVIQNRLKSKQTL